MSSNTIYSRSAISSTMRRTWHLGKRILFNINHNWLGYLLFLLALYVFTPFNFTLNDWSIVRARLITIAELPARGIDSTFGFMEGK